MIVVTVNFARFLQWWHWIVCGTWMGRWAVFPPVAGTTARLLVPCFDTSGLQILSAHKVRSLSTPRSVMPSTQASLRMLSQAKAIDPRSSSNPRPQLFALSRRSHAVEPRENPQHELQPVAAGKFGLQITLTVAFAGLSDLSVEQFPGPQGILDLDARFFFHNSAPLKVPGSYGIDAPALINRP